MDTTSEKKTVGLISLIAKGERKVYRGEELKYIAMPCGGIGAGQVEVSGDGRICFTEAIYNQMQPSNAGLGYSSGLTYLNPQTPSSRIDNGFAIRIQEAGQAPRVLELSGKDFDEIQFIGEYPIATLDYGRSGERIPVRIQSEVFSPFVPLSLRDSANPATMLRFSVSNKNDSPLDVTLAGWLSNATFPQQGEVRVNRAMRAEGLTGVMCSAEPPGGRPRGPMADDGEGQQHTDPPIGQALPRGNGHAQYGDMTMAVLDANARACTQCGSRETFLESIRNGSDPDTEDTTYADGEAGCGGVMVTFTLAPGQARTVTFLVAWYFPNFIENGQHGDAKMGMVGRLYSRWYAHSFDVAAFVAANQDRLYRETRLFRDTYFDTTLPYWLANRITMPVSTLACGNITLYENGRMYAYEGVGFCFGTCGHVLNFVTAIACLFPELERSVRLQQDLDPDMGYDPASGRVNFRGHDGSNPAADHAYASDAQSGYVLKLYREHLQSPDNRFLDAVWPKVKRIIGYLIFRDGAGRGIEPNGVLEDLQTFWDPMWYGPNPYNNTLYLAALRAAEAMARLKGEIHLSDRYRAIYESGRRFMCERMWNGEYFVHLYPHGFLAGEANGMGANGVVTPQDEQKNAQGYIDSLERGEPHYFVSSACDAQQLFGQTWAHQLGLGYILPTAMCRTAAQSIFRHCWTPDISTVYDRAKPENRILAAPGEAAMVNGAWPKDPPRSFENTWDKSDVWTGLEYQAACDMIHEGLLKEGLTVIRAVHDRYDGRKRNPWNENNGADHYTRAMHSWNILLTLTGMQYDGPAGKIGFGPRISPENFKGFFSAAEGWGCYAQNVEDGLQKAKITIRWGHVKLQEIVLATAGSTAPTKAAVRLGGKTLVSRMEMKDGRAHIRLAETVTIPMGGCLETILAP